MKRTFKIIGEICRHHISLMLLITLLDLILIACGQEMTVCFALLAPQRLLALGSQLAATHELDSLLVSGWVCAAVIMAMLAVCLAASYRRSGWLLCAAVMVALDTGIAVLGIVQGDNSYYVDLATHIWCLVALVAGYLLPLLAANLPDATECACPASHAQSRDALLDQMAERSEARDHDRS